MAILPPLCLVILTAWYGIGSKYVVVGAVVVDDGAEKGACAAEGGKAAVDAVEEGKFGVSAAEKKACGAEKKIGRW